MPSAGELTSEERERYQLGRASFERGDLEVALGHLTRLLETREGFADIHYMVGLLHERRGDLEDSAKSLEKAMRINPGYAEAALALVSVYEQQGEFERSRALAEEMATATARRFAAREGLVDPTTRGKLANLQAALGDAYREVGEIRDAIEAYRKALDRCPDFHDIRHRLGVALRESGLPHQAAQEFRRVLRANPGFLPSAIQLGITYYGLGRTGDAMRAWEEVLEKDPGREDARAYLRMMRGT